MNRPQMAKISRLVPPRTVQLLGQCQKLAAERWPGLLKAVLDRVDDAFFDLANRAESSQRQQSYFDAMRCLRLRRPQLERAFENAMQTACDAHTKGQARGPGPLAAPLGDELSLVAQDDVEEALAITNLVEGVKSRCRAELYPLEQRLGHLVGDTAADPNPFGPEALGAAFKALAQNLDAPIEVRITLLKLCDKHAGPALQDLYRALNDLLVREGVLPRLTPAVARGATGGRTRVIIESEAGTAEAAGPDVFQTLQQLMQTQGGLHATPSATGGGAGTPGGAWAPAPGGLTAGASGAAAMGVPGGNGMPAIPGLPAAGVHGAFGGPGIPAGPGVLSGLPGVPGTPTAAGMIGTAGASGAGTGHPGIPGSSAGTPTGAAGLAGAPAEGVAAGGGAAIVPMATTALVSALTRLQHGEGVALGECTFALDPTLAATGTVNVLRGLREAAAASELEQTDRYTLDIVSLLFDYILDDPAIPDAIKALIGRLQIPLLKVALLDKDLFSRKSHPARRLLDGLAEAAIGWSAGDREHDALLEKIQYIVFRVVEEFDSDLGLFSTLLEELNGFLADEAQEAERRAEISTRSLQTRERVVLAKMAVDDAVKARMDGVETREFVVQFVRDYWRQLLIVTHVERGADSPEWQEQLAVIDDLLWSVRPKATADEKKELTTRLPKLIKALRNGVKELDMAPAVFSRFMSMLASVHVVSVKQVEEATLAERKITQHLAAEAEAAAAAQSEAEFVRQALDRLFARKAIEPTELDIDLSAFDATPEDESPVPEDAAAGVPDAILEEVMSLDLGDWLEFDLPENGGTVRARFTWISPATGQYLFTDREGRKAFDLTMNGLAQQFQAGRARRVATQPDPLFDRAIGVLLERFEQPAVA